MRRPSGDCATLRRAISWVGKCVISRQIFDAIRKLNETEKLTVFLVEQNAHQALRLAHRGYVMVNGRITMAGTGVELLSRPEVRAAYLEGGAQH